MTLTGKERSLVVTADDFGKSSSVNRAILEASENGILTAASIMPGGEAFEEAVNAVRRSRLCAGLHLTLCDGRAVLPRSRIPDLVDERGNFEPNPSRAWRRYSQPELFGQLNQEIGAQFDRLEKAGIRPTHVDGHHHLHMHPAIFALVCRHASRRGIRWVRIPREPAGICLGGSRRGPMPLIEWAVFRVLAVLHRKLMVREGMHAADRVLGLSSTGGLNPRRLFALIAASRGLTEIFTHPDCESEAGRTELSALTALPVRTGLAALGITLTGFRRIVLPESPGEPEPERA